MQGIVKMKDDEYFAHPNISQSGFKKFLKSPHYFKHNIEFSGPRSKAFDDGSAIHCFALEPDLFGDYFAEWDGDFRTKEAKEWKQARLDEGKTVVKSKDIGHLKIMGELLYSGLGLADIPAERKEVAAFGEIGGVACKAKADFIDNDGYIWDIKTTRELKIQNYEDGSVWRDMVTYGYHIQAMWYLTLFEQFMDIKGYRFAVIEKIAPYDYMVLKPSEQRLEQAFDKMTDGLGRYAECIEEDIWPGYDKELLEVS